MSILLTFDNSTWYDRVLPSGVKLGEAYAEDGFTVREAFGDAYGLDYKIADPSAATPETAGAYLSAMLPEITRDGGLRFGVSQIDLDLQTGGPTTITFTGVKEDGTLLNYSFGADGAAGAYQTVTLPDSFKDLVKFDFHCAADSQIAFDNIVLTEPAVITGGPGAQTLTAGSTSTDLYGYGGNDTLIGGAGADWLDGGQGDDTMIGGKGDDLYFISSHGDKVIEQPGGGIDTVRSGLSYVLPTNVENLELIYSGNASGWGNDLDNRITGNTGDNDLRGYGGNDVLIGGAGNDTLDGGAGNDILRGGAGLDLLTGGRGADLFQFTRDELGGGLQLAVITDFSHAQGDKISVNGLFVFNFLGQHAFTGPTNYDDPTSGAGEFRYEVTAKGVTLMGDVDGDGVADWTIDLTGAHSLQASDFAIV